MFQSISVGSDVGGQLEGHHVLGEWEVVCMWGSISVVCNQCGWIGAARSLPRGDAAEV